VTWPAKMVGSWVEFNKRSYEYVCENASDRNYVLIGSIAFSVSANYRCDRGE